MSGRDLWGGIDWDFIHMAQHFNAVQDLGTRFSGVDGDMVHFDTQSESTPGHEWHQWIRMTELPDVIEDPDMTIQDKVKLALQGDLQVHCNCPAFKYWGYQYITTQLGAAVTPEHRPPNVRNPQRKGDVCKHLALVLRVLPFWWNNIAGELAKQGYDRFTQPEVQQQGEQERAQADQIQQDDDQQKDFNQQTRQAFLRDLWGRTGRRERGEESLKRGRRCKTFEELVEEQLNSV